LSKRSDGLNYLDLGFNNVAGGGIGVMLDVRINNAGPVVYSNAIPEITANEWFFLTVTRDGTTGAVNFYIGGTGGNDAIQLNSSGTSGTGGLNANSAPLTIGNTFANTARNGDVSFGDIRIYVTPSSRPRRSRASARKTSWPFLKPAR